MSSSATIEINSEFSKDEAFREIESFSHIWVIFVFHAIKNEKWKPMVRPPRLGGNQRVGVFATRSMFRPNPVGLSVVELKAVERVDDKIVLTILGGDFLDRSPVIDIKPYIPYADSIVTAKSGYATEKPQVQFDVEFTDTAMAEVKQSLNKYPELEKVIIGVLQLDPRPAYQKNKKTYAMKLYDYDLQWHVEEQKIIVTSLTVISS